MSSKPPLKTARLGASQQASKTHGRPQRHVLVPPHALQISTPGAQRSTQGPVLLLARTDHKHTCVYVSMIGQDVVAELRSGRQSSVARDLGNEQIPQAEWKGSTLQ